jgi:hypothetical protein
MDAEIQGHKWFFSKKGYSELKNEWNGWGLKRWTVSQSAEQQDGWMGLLNHIGRIGRWNGALGTIDGKHWMAFPLPFLFCC